MDIGVEDPAITAEEFRQNVWLLHDAPYSRRLESLEALRTYAIATDTEALRYRKRFSRRYICVTNKDGDMQVTFQFESGHKNGMECAFFGLLRELDAMGVKVEYSVDELINRGGRDGKTRREGQ